MTEENPTHDALPESAVEAALEALLNAFGGEDGRGEVYVQENSPTDWILDGRVDLPRAVRKAIEAAAPYLKDSK